MSDFGRTIFSINVQETDRNRAYWASRPWISVDNHDVRVADILIVPWERFRDMEALFPQGTTDFFRFVKQFGQVSVAVAASPENYREVALHADEFRLPTLVVSALLLPMVANIISARIDHWITPPTPDDTLEVELIVERETGPCISLKYKGPPGKAIETLVEHANQCIGTDGDDEK